MASEDNKPIVEYKRLGSSGLRVSVPIIGCMSYGSSEWAPWVLDEEAALPVLKAAWDRGINTFDTANVYSNGVSESILATFIEKYNIPRKEVVILTKCFGVVAKSPGVRTATLPHLKNTRDYVNKSGLSRGAIFDAVDASLERLKTPYIDLLQIHRYDPDTPVEETMKALHDLVVSGKVRYIGASSMRCWQFQLLQFTAEKNGWTKFVSMQDEYSLLYREDERELIPYCNYSGVGIIPWGPIGGGALTRPIAESNSSLRYEATLKTPWARQYTEADKAIIARVEEIAKKKGWSMAQVALAWTWGNVTSPIVGLSSVKRLEESVITGYELTEEERKYLEEPYVSQAVRGHP